MFCGCCFFVLLILPEDIFFVLIFRESRRQWGERGVNIDVRETSSTCPNQGPRNEHSTQVRALDRKSSRWPFGVWADTPTIGPHWPGLKAWVLKLIKIVVLSLSLNQMCESYPLFLNFSFLISNKIGIIKNTSYHLKTFIYCLFPFLKIDTVIEWIEELIIFSLKNIFGLYKIYAIKDFIHIHIYLFFFIFIMLPTADSCSIHWLKQPSLLTGPSQMPGKPT